MRTYTNELFELEIARQRVEASQQDLKKAQSEVKHAKEALLRHQNAVNWYQWIDAILNGLGPEWSIVSDTSNPEICGNPELQPSNSYKGKVAFSKRGSPVRVWTHQQGVVCSEALGIQHVWSLTGPNPQKIFSEILEYISETDIDIAELQKTVTKKAKQEKV
jgi:hypothetical protein